MSYYGPPPPQFQMPYQFPQTQNPKSNIGLYISSSLFLVLILISIVLIVLIAVNIIVIPGLNAPSTIDSTSTSSSSGSTTNSSSGSTVPTVRQTLTKLCPIDPAANGMINKTNLASRDDYLFSACTAAGTCDSIIPDNISKILLSTLSPGGGGACGGWNQPEANPQIIWDNTNKRWNMAPAPAAVLNTKQRLSQLCPVDPAANGMINKGNVATRDDYLFSACNGAGTCDSITPDNTSQILINSLSSGNFCGGWGQGSLTWDNTNKRWNNSSAPATTTIPASFTLNAKTGLWSAPGDKFTCPGIANRNTTGNNGDFNNYCVFNTAQDAVAAANTIADCIGYVTFPNGYYQLIKMAPIVGGPSGSQFFSKDPNYVQASSVPSPFFAGNIISLQNPYGNNYMSIYAGDTIPTTAISIDSQNKPVKTLVDLHESTSANAWSRWTVVDVGSGNIALKSLWNGRFLSVCDNCTTLILGSVDVHGSDSTQKWVQWTPKSQTDGTYQLVSVYNGKILKACDNCISNSPYKIIVSANGDPNDTGDYTKWKVSSIVNSPAPTYPGYGVAGAMQGNAFANFAVYK